MAKKKTSKKQTSKKKLSQKQSDSKRAFPKFELFKKLLLSDLCITPTEAAMQSYNCKNRNVASSIASENLRKLAITMPQLMDRMGLTDEQDLEDLKRLRKAQKLHLCDIHIKKKNGKYVVNQNSNDFMDVDDNQTQLKALELTSKLKGRLNGKVEVSGEVSHKHFILEAIRKSKSIPKRRK